MCHHVDMEIDWEAVVEDRESEPEEFATAEDADEIDEIRQRVDELRAMADDGTL